MQTIAQEYLLLFNTLTDAEETLRRLQLQLMEAQQRAEELFLEGDDPGLAGIRCS
jgi:hypothetical protein